jgi:hypothetical protein
LANIPGLILWISCLTRRIAEWEGLIQQLALVLSLIGVKVTAVQLLQLSLRTRRHTPAQVLEHPVVRESDIGLFGWMVRRWYNVAVVMRLPGKSELNGWNLCRC